MLLICGGQFDTNVQVLLNRLRQRNVPFCDLLVGPGHPPRLQIDLQSNVCTLNGNAIAPTGCFFRHDVFLYECSDTAAARASAMNWYHAIQGWVASQPSIRSFNQFSHLRENNKIQNLLLARDCGLSTPDTIVTNHLAGFDGSQEFIRKPVAGGEYTRLLGDMEHGPSLPYPHFVQPRLQRPEMRFYRIGARIIAFRLNSPAIDYRSTRDVEITAADVPASIGGNLLRLCDRLALDFAAADFMEDQNGGLQFLEINSQPMFTAFDRAVDGRICDAIIDELSGCLR